MTNGHRRRLGASSRQLRVRRKGEQGTGKVEILGASRRKKNKRNKVMLVYRSENSHVQSRSLTAAAWGGVEWGESSRE